MEPDLSRASCGSQGKGGHCPYPIGNLPPRAINSLFSSISFGSSFSFLPLLPYPCSLWGWTPLFQSLHPLSPVHSYSLDEALPRLPDDPVFSSCVRLSLGIMATSNSPDSPAAPLCLRVKAHIPARLLQGC